MNWEAAIARNRQALLEIILAAMASVGLVQRGRLTTLPFHLYRKALFIIRVAETAVRRLIFIAAHDLKLRMAELERAKKVPNGGALSPSHLSGVRRTGETRGSPCRGGGVSHQMSGPNQHIQVPAKSITPAFEPLSNSPKTNPKGGALPLPSGAPASGLPLKGGAKNKSRGQGEGAFAQPRMFKFQAPSSTPKGQSAPLFRRYPRAIHPRISFPLIEPLKTFTADPRDFTSMHHEQPESSREPAPAFNLGNRLLALHFALTNIERQARRLLRWEARRDAALKLKIPHRMTPMRPGLPPFYSRKPTTEIEHILKECHGLTHYARERRGTIP